MSNRTMDVIQNISPVGEAAYEQAVGEYFAQIESNPYVRAVYQIGSVGHPGISDLDLIVVVDNVRDPFWLNRLSVHQSAPSDLTKYIFPHDVYVYDVASFREIQFSLYANNLRLIYGEQQDMTYCSPEEERWLSLQIIFDFTASRLAQFKNIYAGGKLDSRGVLLRVASIKHSANLLRNVGIELPGVKDFVRRVFEIRDNYATAPPQILHDLFVESFARFSDVVEAAADYFAGHALSYYSDVEAGSALRLNAVQLLRFFDPPSRLNRPEDQLTVFYPRVSFFHFLAFTRYEHLIGTRARSHLAYSGDEVYELHGGYEDTLRRRLQAISDHFTFLRENRLHFAMKGNPGFVTAWHNFQGDAPALSIPPADTPPVGYSLPGGNEMLLDRITRVEKFDKLKESFDFAVEKLDLDRAEYDTWIEDFIPDWQQRYADKLYKKPLELFATYKLLDPQPDDSFMDAAGGINTYLHKIPAARKYLQNIVVDDDIRRRFGNEIVYLEGDACAIPVEDGSITKISMHHSFEHFQADSDSMFIREAQRMLRLGGRCVILPIFLGDAYVEVSRLPKVECPFDSTARYIVDPSTRLTGGPSCGDFARVYDLPAFERRVLNVIDRARFRISIVELLLGGQSIPYEDLPSHEAITRINFPYRALVIDRIN